MAKKDNTLLYLALAAGAYFVFIKPRTAAPVLPSTGIGPGGMAVAPVISNNPLAALLSAGQSIIKNLGGGSGSSDASQVATNQDFANQQVSDVFSTTPLPPVNNPVSFLQTAPLLAVSPTANITDQVTRDNANADYYQQYEESFISGLHNDGYMR